MAEVVGVVSEQPVKRASEAGPDFRDFPTDLCDGSLQTMAWFVCPDHPLDRYAMKGTGYGPRCRCGRPTEYAGPMYDDPARRYTEPDLSVRLSGRPLVLHTCNGIWKGAASDGK